MISSKSCMNLKRTSQQEKQTSRKSKKVSKKVKMQMKSLTSQQHQSSFDRWNRGMIITWMSRQMSRNLLRTLIGSILSLQKLIHLKGLIMSQRLHRILIFKYLLIYKNLFYLRFKSLNQERNPTALQLSLFHHETGAFFRMRKWFNSSKCSTNINKTASSVLCSQRQKKQD